MRIAMAATAALLAGCAATAPVTPPPTPSASQSPSKRTQEFETRFVLQDRVQHTVGEDAEKAYGWSDYTGRTRFLDNRFRSELLVANDFVRGNGVFEGFVTLSSPEGIVGLRVTGVAAPGTQGDGSAYSGETEIIGGTDEYDTLAGRGSFTGERTGASGSPIDVRVTLELIDPR
jgi:hypothetical protein